MSSRFAPGDTVQTRLGKGIVREVRNRGRLLIEVHGRALVVSEAEVSAVAHDTARRSRAPAPDVAVRPSRAAAPRSELRTRSAEIDLHGLTVEQALDLVQQALNDALLADLGELRLIHGRSGGRLRAALHRYLRETPAVQSFRVDPRNEGVTIVVL